MAERVDLMQGSIKDAGKPNPPENAAEIQEIAMIKGWMSEAKRFRAEIEKRWDTQDKAY